MDAYTRRMVVNCRPAESEPDSAAERRAVLDALARLPLRRRATLVPRYWEDLAVEQTARIMRSTVKGPSVRGLPTLRGLLTESFHESAERTR